MCRRSTTCAISSGERDSLVIRCLQRRLLRLSRTTTAALPTVAVVDDRELVLQEVWGRVGSQFTKWQPEVQQSFAQQLERLMETCSKQNESVNGGALPGSKTSTIHSGPGSKELGEFAERQEAVEDAFLRINAQGMDVNAPMALPLQPPPMQELAVSTPPRPISM